MKKQHRFLAAKAGGVLRTASFMNQDHLVVPVIALVEGVLHAVNAPAPELVMEEEFARAYKGWNGRPVMLDHPQTEDGHVSANSPSILEEFGLGTVFNSHVEDKKLKMEAWINLARASKVDGATEILAAMQAGKTIEVSVGVFVQNEEEHGVFNGKEYDMVWHDLVPDHLAILPLGAKGACSVEMGCGAPRVAKEGGGTVSWKKKFLELLESFRPSQDGQTDVEIRQALDTALRATIPAYMGIDSVYPVEGKVIYAAMPGEKFQLFELAYALGEDGVPSFEGDPVEVAVKTVYEPVTAASAAPCGCTKNGKAAPAAEGEDAMTKKERVAALLPRLAQKFPALFCLTDAPALELMSDERLTALEGKADEVVEPAKAEVKPEPKKEETVVVETEAEKTAKYLAAAPESVRRVLARAEAQEKDQRTALVSSIKAASGVYTDADLDPMPIESLEKLSKALGAKAAPSREGAPLPRAAGDANDVDEPPSIDTALKTLREQRAS